MEVYLYSGVQKLVEKSGVGRALRHQQIGARQNHIGLANCLENADVVHINTVFPQSLLAAKKAKRLGIPVVYHAHSTREDFRNSFLGANQLDGLFGKWIKYCYSQGTIVVTPSEYARQLLLSYGIKKEIRVVSNGIDLAYYDRTYVDQKTFRRRYGYKDTQKVIMCVGLTIERKGILDFVELAKRMPEYQFIWFGEANRHMLPKRIRKILQIKLPNLKFAGYAEPDMLREAYAGSDLFLFPSYEETEGIVVLEALAMKIPILLRDISVYADWLQDGKEVYKGRNTDEFQALIKRILKEEAADLTENGYRVARERAIEKTGAQLREIYEGCMKKASRAELKTDAIKIGVREN